MAAVAISQDRLRQLDREIADWNAISSALSKKLYEARKEAIYFRWRSRYLRLARSVRTPSTTDSFFRIGILIGITVASLITYVAAQVLLGSIASSLIGVVGSIAVVGFAALFYSPTDDVLLIELGAASRQRQECENCIEECAKRLKAAKISLEALADERRRLLSSIDWQRSSLLNQNWKAMRGDDWENFLVEVFRALGADAKRTRARQSSDQGVDLIVKFGLDCFAVQAKGYENPVGNDAIQQVYAGAKHWQCNACAVVTNSRFTRKAKELAVSTGCVLIGEDNFPDFVMGRIELVGHLLHSDVSSDETSRSTAADTSV